MMVMMMNDDDDDDDDVRFIVTHDRFIVTKQNT